MVTFLPMCMHVHLIFQFLSPLLSHPNGTVREPAIKLVHDLYREVRTYVHVRSHALNVVWVVHFLPFIGCLV